MRAKNVTASITEVNGEVKCWNASFTLPFSIGENPFDPNNDVKIMAARKRIEKMIANAIESIDFNILEE